MEITTKNENGVLTVGVAGRLDTTNANELEETVETNVPGVTDLVFDLRDLVYTSSAGLRVFLKAAKAVRLQNGSMKLTNVSAPILEILEMTGFTELMTVEPA